jgi:hypothetical protein
MYFKTRNKGHGHDYFSFKSISLSIVFSILLDGSLLAAIVIVDLVEKIKLGIIFGIIRHIQNFH